MGIKQEPVLWSTAEDFPWTGYEQPIAGHADPEDPAMLTGMQPDGSFCHSGICR